MTQRRGKRWSLGDVLDYETLLADTVDDPEALHRDREGWTSPPVKGPARRRLRSWLRYRRGLATVPLPGMIADRIARITGIALGLTGLVAGVALGWGVLAYGGRAAVNLVLALALLVGVPLLGSLVSLILALLPRRAVRTVRIFDRLERVFRRSVGVAKRLGTIDKAQADAVVAGMSRFRERSGLYGGILRWGLSVPIQFRATCFRIGILVAVIWRGVVQDLAFAWQTTLRVTPEAVHRIAVAVARPWISILSTPTPEQVAGSRVVLKEGIAGLDNADLVSWWPFFVGAAIVYGVLPRVLLLCYALLRRWTASVTLRFSDGRSRRLLAVLTSPAVDVTGGEPPAESGSGNGLDVGETPFFSGARIRVLAPVARDDLLSPDTWRGFLAERFAVEMTGVTAVDLDDEDDADILAGLAGEDPSCDGILVVFEGWRPYTAAAALYIDAVLDAAPRGAVVVAALAGRPGRGFRMDNADDDTVSQWRRLLPAETTGGGPEIVELRGPG